MKLIPTKQSFWLILLALFALGCGNHAEKDGSSGSSKSGKISANAGDDITVALGDEVILDGSASVPQSEIQRYYW